MGAEKLMLLTGESALSGAAPLFDGLEDTLIQTALEGEMGSVWLCAGDGQPVAAFCMTGDFVFPAGDAEAPEALLLLEGLRGKPLGAKALQYTQMAGVTVLIMLMLFATKNDIVRIFFGN